jgi:hypothetical protein
MDGSAHVRELREGESIAQSRGLAACWLAGILLGGMIILSLTRSIRLNSWMDL